LAGILTFTDKVIDPEYSRRIQEEMMLTQVERLIYADGYADGKKEGLEEGVMRFGNLVQRLMSDERYQDASRAATDAGFRESLYLEYGIPAFE